MTLPLDAGVATGRGGPGTSRELRAALWLTLLGVAVRAGHLVAPHIDSDQAVFGLQALHVLKGEFPAFSWGYSYIGTLQSYLLAPLFFVFGPSRGLLNGMALLFYAGYSLSLHHLAAAYFPGRRERLLAVALGALAPGYFVIHGVWARHGYPETFCFGTLLLALMCSRLDRAQSARFHAGLFFVAGVAWWSNFLILPYFVPLAVYLVAQLLLGSSSAGRARTLLAGALGFVAGSLPFWVHNLRAGFPSLTMFGGPARPGRALDAGLRLLWTEFPVLVGAREPRQGWNVPWLGHALVALCAAALLVFLVRRTAALPQIRSRRRLAPGDLLVVFLAALPAIYLASGSALQAGVGSTRYLLPFYSLYPIVVVDALSLLRGLPRGAVLAGAGAAFVLAMNAVSAWSWNPLFQPAVREKYRREMATERAIFAGLESAGVRRVLMDDYWAAYRLTFDAGERMIFDTVDSRQPGYHSDIFAAGEPMGYLLRKRQAPAYEEAFRLLGYTFTRRPVAAYELFTDFRRMWAGDLAPIPAARYELRGGGAPGAHANLGDRGLETRHPFFPGATDGEAAVEVLFAQPVRLAGLALILEQRSFAPAGIRVTDLDTGRVLVESERPRFGYSVGGRPYIAGETPLLEVGFAPAEVRGVRIAFLGSTRREGFSAAELVLFAAVPAAGGASDEELLARVGARRDFGPVYTDVGGVRGLERSLGRKVGYEMDRRVDFRGGNLFVFRREWLAHNLAVLDRLGVARDVNVGRTYAAIVTRPGAGRARWLDRALFSVPGP